MRLSNGLLRWTRTWTLSVITGALVIYSIGIAPVLAIPAECNGYNYWDGLTRDSLGIPVYTLKCPPANECIAPTATCYKRSYPAPSDPNVSVSMCMCVRLVNGAVVAEVPPPGAASQVCRGLEATVTGTGGTSVSFMCMPITCSEPQCFACEPYEIEDPVGSETEQTEQGQDCQCP